METLHVPNIRTRSIDLLLVVVGAAISVSVTFLGLNTPILRLIFAAPLIALLPGYALVAMLFADRSLEIMQRIALSIALSVATTLLGGFVLNLSVWGMTADSWSIYLGGVTVV